MKMKIFKKRNHNIYLFHNHKNNNFREIKITYKIYKILKLMINNKYKLKNKFKINKLKKIN